MKFSHPAVTSDIFKLIATLELDLVLGDHLLPTRIELFRDTERKRRFRCRMWERELYHLQLTLTEGTGKQKRRMESDEEVLVERTWELSDKFDDFEASSPKAAMKKFLDKLRQYLDRATLQE